MKFKVKVGKDLGASFHAPTCRVVVNATRRENVHEVEAADAAAAVAEWDAYNEVAERGLPKTKVCGCCR